VVKFTAPAWCGPCKLLEPKFKELAEKWGDKVKFVMIDIDHAPTIAKHMTIRSIPMIVFYENGIRNDDLTVRGYKPDDLEISIVKLVENVKDDSESSESEEVSETPPEYDSDPAHNEYGEDCNFVIEKTAELLE
jgi:thioredoxin-like negative regulator of GroEL